MMLQQTQVSRVVEKYREFLRIFPDINSLAHASTADVIRVWKGLGYNRRAVYLKRAAEVLMNIHNGIFPETENDLKKIPGIGTYTARAVLVFAFRKDIAVVDTNIRKIITEFFYDGIHQKESVIEQKAAQLVPYGKSWEWHQALMDYGALELSKKKGKTLGTTRKEIKAIPFRDTKRFLRGRILDLIRDNPRKQTELIALVTKTYGKDRTQVRIALSDMIREGLLTKQKNILQLPK